MVNWAKKTERKADVKARANEPSYRFHTCRVVGCGQPSRAATQDGLDTFFCRSHADHHSRHGSPYKRSYGAKELAPYHKKARVWLKDREGDLWVKNAILRVETLYNTAGPHVEAFRLRGLSPEERAKAAWARLRKAKVDPRKVIEAWLAIEMIVSDDIQPDGKPEFKRVQIAKVVHKMASGTHKSWSTAPGGKADMHLYPRSRGRVLRHIGADIEGATELILSHHRLPRTAD